MATHSLALRKKDHVSFTHPEDPFIRFYDKRFKESYFLSNFYPTPIPVSINQNGEEKVITFYCSEGIYHARRAPEFPWERFFDLEGPAAWAAAQSLKKTQVFAENKFEIMLEVVRAKFSTNKELTEKLISTKDRYLVERTKDKFWGDGLDGTGENQLGIICMIVRKELGGEEGLVAKPQEYLEFLKYNFKQA